MHLKTHPVSLLYDAWIWRGVLLSTWMYLPPWEETGLEHAQYETKRDHLSPRLHKGESKHCDSPQKRYRRQEDSRSKLSEDDGGRWLKEHIGDEEHQHDGRVAESNQLEINTHARDDGDSQIRSVHK